MRRTIEFFLYTVTILFFIARYVAVEDAPSPITPDGPPILVPDDTRLPRDDGSVRVELDMEVKNSVGTAFAVDSRGTYVTARHVVDGCSQVFLVSGPRQLEPVLSAVSEGVRDFAVLRARQMRAEPFALSATSPRRGDDGFMMGYPQGHAGDVRATVIGRTEMRSSGRYSAREPVVAWVERERRPSFGGHLGGISGGPVFNEDGYVVGTVVAGAPRRGRVYTTHPRVFRDTGLISAEGKTVADLGRDSYEQAGKRLRASHAIAQVYCKAG